MCGISGIVKQNTSVDTDELKAMNTSLYHRGPDDEGCYINDEKNIGLAHRRLSFLDLSAQGRQPMKNNADNLIIVFNGEIYNYLELKNELKSCYSFKTNTDTEVILAGYEKWGIEVINKLKGMFAFALFDNIKQKLFLVRDRFGIKPLYYFHDKSQFVFASEIKAFFTLKSIEKNLDYSSVGDFFVYRYIPSPKTIWGNIKKIPPAHYLVFDIINNKSELKEYWKLIAKEEHFEERKIIEKVNALLENAVGQHTRADVPVGSFLSGGYDSSALVYYMKKAGKFPNTFSIGFSDWANSEDKFAKEVANHLHVNNESIIANEDSLNYIDLIPDVYDEPIADISIIPTYLVSKLARSKVKTVLSGEGADEIFGGYTWQHEFLKNNYDLSYFTKLKNKIFNNHTVNFYAGAMAMGRFDKPELYKMFHPDIHSNIAVDPHWFYQQHFKKELSPLKSIQYLDTKCFMGELVLTKIDRASMANSLEVRVPFLDHELFEFIFSLNEKSYFKRHQTKFMLFKNIENVLPKNILHRKKQGFVGPDSYYMNIEWYKKQLQESALVKDKIIKQEYLQSLFTEHYTWKLWKIIVFEKWYQKWVKNYK